MTIKRIFDFITYNLLRFVARAYNFKGPKRFKPCDNHSLSRYATGNRNGYNYGAVGGGCCLFGQLFFRCSAWCFVYNNRYNAQLFRA